MTAIFLDEAAFEREEIYIPLLTTDFILNPGIVVFGDQKQLKPYTQVRVDGGNPLPPQLELSLMARLINMGFLYHMLVEQYRMVPDIAIVCNALTYGRKLINSEGTLLYNRPIAKDLRYWLLHGLTNIPGLTFKKKEEIHGNRVMLDLPISTQNQTVRPPSAGGVHGKYAHDSTHYMKEFIEMFDNHEIKVDTEAPLPWPTYYKFHATKHNSFELRD